MTALAEEGEAVEVELRPRLVARAWHPTPTVDAPGEEAQSTALNSPWPDSPPALGYRVVASAPTEKSLATAHAATLDVTVPFVRLANGDSAVRTGRQILDEVALILMVESREPELAAVLGTACVFSDDQTESALVRRLEHVALQTQPPGENVAKNC